MNLEDVLLRNTRANQPVALAGAEGTLYYVTDEAVTEQSRGGAWVDYSDAGTPVVGGITQLTGAVTAGPGSGSQAASIANDAVTTAKILDANVTYAKVQNVTAPSRVLGRKTAGAGVIEELTLSEILDFIASAAQGDILYRDAAAWARLPTGTAGQVLTSGGAGANPAWATPSGGGGSSDLVVLSRAITELELESINTAPLTLVAAPGADKVIVPIMWHMEFDVIVIYGGSNIILNLNYNGDTTQLTESNITWAVANLGKRGNWSRVTNTNSMIYTSFDPRNKALQLKGNANPGSPGTGVATAKLNLTYMIATTS